MIKSVIIDRSANSLVVGPAIPIEVMTAAQAAGMPVVGKPMRVVRATNADMIAMKYKSVGMRPIPVVVSTENIDIVGGPVQPVYVLSGLLDALEYTNKILALGPIAYWTMGESSGSVSLDASGNGRNGTYTGVTLGQTGIGDGRTAPSFDGATSKNNVFSASLAAAFNKDEGTAMAWCKVSGSGVWTDGIARFVLRLAADANNLVSLVKQSGNNRFDAQYAGGGTFRLQSLVSAPLGYFHAAITWSVIANQVIVYFNGAAMGVPLATPTFTGPLASTTCMVGAQNTTPLLVFSGNAAHVAVFNRPLLAAEVASAATIYVP